MTYNIRGYTLCDSLFNNRHWYIRKNYIIKTIQEEKPDILGIQELFNIPKFIEGYCNNNKEIKGYDFDPLIEKDIMESYKYENIIISSPSHLIRDYVRERLSKLGYSYYFKETSKTPKMIFFSNKFKFISGDEILYGNKSFCTYSFLENKDGNEIFLVVNVHLLSGENAINERKLQIDVLITKLKEINTKQNKIILMGDLNIEFNSDEYFYLLNKMTELNLKSLENTEINFTYNNFGNNSKKIDYIFLEQKINIKNININTGVFYKNEHETDEKNIIFPSDHWPLKVVVE